MAVRFEEIVFQNENGISVSLTLEAPVGRTVVKDHPVSEGQTYKVAPGVDNCSSALCIARASGHEEDRQEFTTLGRPENAFLLRLSLRHLIGSIHGTVIGRTEKGA